MIALRCARRSLHCGIAVRSMSALGQTRQTRSSRMMIYVRFAPKADIVGDKAPGPLSAMNGHRAIRSPRRRARVGQAKSGNSVHTVAQGALEAGPEKSPKFLSSCAVGCSQKAPK